ncbi:hypothetical protein [Pseudoclavibacter sp. AY1F1]|uniref:hypothetical protein n=1 Tax=Pseudoclavibacter sp. AY1F1 TaxID=2080583 RepID=UPI0011AFEBD1|nr:hypothetical protein [Pseudoclavibacter sp. AY1F1]
MSKPAAAFLALSALLSLVGCAGPEAPGAREMSPTATGGQTRAELISTLDGMAGLSFSGVGGSEPNVKGNTGFTFQVRLDPEYVLVDPAGLVEFLAESAWSVNDDPMPNTSVEINYTGAPGDQLDLAAVAGAEGWLSPSGGGIGVAANGFSRVVIPVSDSAVEKGVPENLDRLGDWPGVVPETPSDLVAPRVD